MPCCPLSILNENPHPATIVKRLSLAWARHPHAGLDLSSPGWLTPRNPAPRSAPPCAAVRQNLSGRIKRLAHSHAADKAPSCHRPGRSRDRFPQNCRSLSSDLAGHCPGVYGAIPYPHHVRTLQSRKLHGSAAADQKGETLSVADPHLINATLRP
jgi:hypothetical protein